MCVCRRKTRRVSEQACAHILSLSLFHTQRLTASDLLLGVYSKQEKRRRRRKVERKKKLRRECYFPDVTRRRKTQEDWGKSIIVFYSKLTKCIGWIDKRGRRMKKTTKWWGIWFFASFYGRLFFSFSFVFSILTLDMLSLKKTQDEVLFCNGGLLNDYLKYWILKRKTILNRMMT